MRTVEEKVARLLLNPHALRALECDHALRGVIAAGHVFEKQAANLGDIFGNERAGRSAVNHAAIDRLEKVRETHRIGVLLHVVFLGSAYHAHARQVVIEHRPRRNADARLIAEQLLYGRIDDSLEIVLAAHLLVPEVEEGVVEEPLVEQARRIRFGATFVNEAYLEGRHGVLGLDDGVGGDVGMQVGISLLERTQKRDLVVLVLCDHRPSLRDDCHCERVL